MNIFDEHNATRDAAILLEFQEPDQINGSPGFASQPTTSNPASETSTKYPKTSIFSLTYYQDFFNVNTDDVIQKVKYSVVPNLGTNYFEEHIKSKPDLYGPLWICITLSFAIAIGANLLDFLSYVPKENESWKYEFHVITKAALLIFVYAWIVPVILWSLIKWYLAAQMFVSAVELICIYGYSLVIFIPLSLVWAIYLPYLQWFALIAATASSGVILVSSIEPMLSSKNYTVVGGVVLLHIFFALIIFFSFFTVK